jgi:hypothetical protein
MASPRRPHDLFAQRHAASLARGREQARAALDDLRGVVADAMTKKQRLATFMRFAAHVRGSTEFLARGGYLPERADEFWEQKLLAIFPDELPGGSPGGEGAKSSYRTDVEEVLNDFRALWPRTTGADTALVRIFQLVDETYYLVIDYVLRDRYERLVRERSGRTPSPRIDQLERKLSRALRTLGALRAQCQAHAARLVDAEVAVDGLAGFIEELRGGYNGASRYGLLGGMREDQLVGSRRVADGGRLAIYRTDRAPSVTADLPAFDSLVTRIARLLGGRPLKTPREEAARLKAERRWYPWIDKMLVAVFRSYYFQTENSRRVEKRLQRLQAAR